ncbi:MAG: YggT family protein [Sphingomonadales bacterium]
MNLLTGIFQLGDTLLMLYAWAIIISAIISWLIAFNVINTRNQFVYTITDIQHRITAPVLRPLQRIIPDLGGVEISPLILYLIIQFLVRPLWWDIYGVVRSSLA